MFPWLTVEQNAGFGLWRSPPAERDERVRHYIKMVGLVGFEMSAVIIESHVALRHHFAARLVVIGFVRREFPIAKADDDMAVQFVRLLILFLPVRPNGDRLLVVLQFSRDLGRMLCHGRGPRREKKRSQEETDETMGLRKGASAFHQVPQAAILLERSLHRRMLLLRCLQVASKLPGGIWKRCDVPQVRLRELSRTVPMQEVWSFIPFQRAESARACSAV